MSEDCYSWTDLSHSFRVETTTILTLEIQDDIAVRWEYQNGVRCEMQIAVEAPGRITIVVPDASHVKGPVTVASIGSFRLVDSYSERKAL